LTTRNHRLFGFLPQANWMAALAAFTAMFLLLSVVAGMPATAQAQTFVNEQARWADSFVESIGVNVHLHYDDPGNAYGNYEGIIKPRLKELGVRHLRDGIVHERPDKVAKMRELEALGFKFLLIADPRSTTARQARDYVKQFYSVVMIEGANEPDLNLGPNWIAEARAFQQQLYQEFKGDPVTRTISVLAPSLALDDAFNYLGNLSPWVDYGTLHNYYGGRNPGTPGWDGAGYGSIDYRLNQASKVAPGKAVVASETGWHNYVYNPGTHPGTPESVVAKYLPRLLLLHFNRGFVRSYPYELIDEHNDPYDVEDNYGILRNNGTPKPAYTALKNMITLLKDSGLALLPPGKLNYMLSGNVTNLKHTLLQKRDGTFYLALWVEGYNWDPDARIEYPSPPQPVTLTLHSLNLSAEYCVPNDGTTWRPTGSLLNPNIYLNVSDKVMLVKIRALL
jgi:hypothetical protein